ncbi:hypothetical protein V5F77_21790 [Xanthobacter sp. DSM 24535]|uniref:hypothetical protein n=1 Tax=Roseixanthobacter psychrophilus TaxID=3119917 RepID=UPI0037275F72
MPFRSFSGGKPLTEARHARNQPGRRLASLGLLALGAAALAAEPARAQYYPYPPTVYGAPAEMPRVYRAPPAYVPGAAMLPPQEIRSIVLNLGYGRVGRPVLRGRTYMVDAVDGRGPLILAVDAFSGRVQPADPSMYGAPGGPYAPAPAYGAAPPPPAYGAPAPEQRTQPIARAPLPKPRPADSEIASASAPDLAAPAAPPGHDGTADAPENPAVAAAPPEGAHAPKSADPTLASPAPSMSAPVTGQQQPAQTASGEAQTARAAAASAPAKPVAVTPVADKPAAAQPAPQGPTGAGAATPGDGVSAGTASVLSRTAAPAN